ncbi:MAG: hypothetical protein WCI05_05845 [Myxococcales bacterium]
MSKGVFRAACFGMFVAACGGASPGAKAQDAVTELNVNARFGRMEIAIEGVAVKERDAFAKRHKAWGGAIRIADVEVAGLRMRGEQEADVTVRVAWYRVDEHELRNTVVRQRWEAKGGWRLVGEERTEGDMGLLGDEVKPGPVSAPKPQAQFRTIRIGGGDMDER